MVGIDMPMPKDCFIGKRPCPLMDDDLNCTQQPGAGIYETYGEQFENCPLIDLSAYEDDLK